MEESDQSLRRYGCRQEMTTFTGIDEALTDVDLAPDQLLVRLIEGWHYLLDRDPAILRGPLNINADHSNGCNTLPKARRVARSGASVARESVHTAPAHLGRGRQGPTGRKDELASYPNFSVA